MAKVIELTNENFEETTNKGVILILFWAPWAQPCRMVNPVIEELAEDFKGKAKICKINTDEQKELTIKFGVRSIPTIIFMKDGEVVDTMVGAAGKIIFAEKLNKFL